MEEEVKEELVEPAATEDYRKLCSHYARGCSFVSPCCGKVYPCRLCHDDQELMHNIDRFKVSEVECRKCLKRQPVEGSCCECGISFGRYFCSVCRLYADEDKGQFHCDKCGLCRVGGRENFFHCDTCGYCLSLSMKDSHFCRRQASHDNCPVCMEDLHTSRLSMHITECGHLLHMECYRQMLQKGLYQCPQCQKSITDMSAMWRRHDNDREAWQMPHHLRDFKVKVKCRDCEQETETEFHVVGLKCKNCVCGSYNTVRCGREELPEDNGGEEAGQGAGQGAVHVVQNMLRMIGAIGDMRARLGEDGSDSEDEEEEEEEESEEEEEVLHESTDYESAMDGDGEEAEGAEVSAGEPLEASDNQTGYEADSSEIEEDTAAAATATTLSTPSLSTESGQATFSSPSVDPESDQASGGWYGENETSSEEAWPGTTVLSDWTNSFTQSDSHSPGSSSGWETEEEEVIVGEAPDNYDELRDSEENGPRDVTMATETNLGPLGANWYDGNTRSDQNVPLPNLHEPMNSD